MNYILENDVVKLSISNYGAELHSIFQKENKTEYLWNGNPDYWKYHAPTLFPVVGKLVNLKCKIDGEYYEMPSHGLARISQFDLLEKTESYISFKLKYNEETLKRYPYKFSLIIAYTLEDNSVIVTYKVLNMDNKDIYFSLGAHPAFRCPIEEGETLEDYYLSFNRKEDSGYYELTEDAYLKHTKKSLLNNMDILQLSKELFIDETLVFDDLKSKEITIKSKGSSKYISVEFKDFPCLALWRPNNGAPFTCIEPWIGHPDYEDFNKEFSEKEGNVKLRANESFKCFYSITVG